MSLEGDRPKAEGAVALTRARAVAILAMLVAINGLNMVDRNMFGLLLPAIKRDVMLTDAELGLLGGPAFAITYALSGVPIAMLADRLSRRNLIAAGLTFWSLATVATGRAGTAVQLFAARMFLGVGEASNMAPSSSIIADLFPGKRRTLAVAVYTSGGPLGITLGFPFIGWLAQQHGWRVAFVTMGLLGLVLALAFILIGRDPPREHETRGSAKPPAVPFLAGLRILAGSRAFVLMTLAGVCLGTTHAIMNIWAPTFLGRVHGLDLQQTGTVLGLYRGLLGIFSALVGGALVTWLTARHQSWAAQAPAVFCLAMVPVEFAFLWADHPVAWQAALLLDTILLNATTPCTFALLLMIVDSRIRAFGASIYLLVFSLIGQSVGSLCVGMLNDWLAADYGDLAVRFSMSLSPMAIGLCGLLLLLLARNLPPAGDSIRPAGEAQ